MFETGYERVGNLLDDDEKMVFKKQVKPVLRYGNYEVGYVFYGRTDEFEKGLTDCIYIKNRKTNKIEKEIPWGWGRGLPNGSVWKLSMSSIKKVSNDGMIFVSQGEAFKGAGLQRKYYILDLKNNTVIDDLANNTYSRIDLHYLKDHVSSKREDERDFFEDYLLYDKNMVLLKDDYIFNMDTRQRLHLDEPFVPYAHSLFKGLTFAQQYQKGFLTVTDEVGRKCVLNLKDDKLYERTDIVTQNGEKVESEMFSYERISKDVSILDKMPDFLFSALKKEISKCLNMELDRRKSKIKELEMPVEPKKPLIMITKKQKENFEEKMNEYEKNLSKFRENESNIADYKKYFMEVNEHFTKRSVEIKAKEDKKIEQNNNKVVKDNDFAL